MIAPPRRSLRPLPPPPPTPTLLPPAPPQPGPDAPTIYAPVRIHLAAPDTTNPNPNHLYSPYRFYDQDADDAPQTRTQTMLPEPIPARTRWSERHPAALALIVFVAMLTFIGGAILGASAVQSWLHNDVIEPYAPPGAEPG
jgi:hypothetical protein